MHQKLSLLILILLATHFSALSQNWVWAQRMGNTRSDKATCIKTDDSGFIYVSGYFSNQITLGTNAVNLNYTANTQSKEIFLAKFDSTGFCYWARSGGQYYDDRILGMDVDKDGNSVATGTFWEGAGINIGSINISGTGCCDQCFIIKHNSSGTPLWGNYVSSNGGDDQGLDIATDKMGNNYVVGFMSGTNLDCGGTVTATNSNTGSYDHSYWIAKINSTGQFQWARTYGNLPYDTSHNKYIERDIAVCVDDSGGVYVTGGYDHTRPFGPGTLTSSGGYDIFVLKYDTSGVFQWVTNGGSRKDDWSNGICSDKNGHIYVTGEFRDSLIVDTILVKNYDKRDAFVLKLDAKTGKPIWGKRAGGNLGSERGNDVFADSMCNVYVVGDIADSAKFGNIKVPSGAGLQSFVARISPDGKWQWAATGGGLDSNDRCNAVAKGKGKQLYACGFFRSPATYGSSLLTSSGSSDGFFARLNDSSLNKSGSFALSLPADTILCKGDTAFLNIPDHAYLAYYPITGIIANADSSQLAFIPDTTTTYTVSGFSTGDCSEYDTLTFTIVRSPSPIAEFSINPNTALLTEPTFSLNNLSTGATQFQWYYMDTLISTNTNTQKTFDTAGNFCFKLVATNADGCMDSITHCGKIVQEGRIFFPNAFSPNGDNHNDFFGPVISNIKLDEILNYSLKIANRYGEIIFESDDPTKTWDGSKNGNRVVNDMNTYYYFCAIQWPTGKIVEYKGDVTLVR